MGVTVIEDSLGVLQVTNTVNAIEVVSSPQASIVVAQSTEPAFSITVQSGQQGPAGQGVPAGGTSGYILSKASNADYDTAWIVAPTGSGGGTTDPEIVRDTIGSALVAGTNIGINVNDAADTITISTTATVNQTDAYLLSRANHTGTQSADTLTDGATNKAFLGTERTKLAGIATGATANQTDAFLLSRTNHTGTQPSSTISDFNTAVDARVQNIVGAAPAALDTLVELASALGNDANFASTMTTALAGKEPTIAAGTTSQYWKGNKTWATLDKTAVGLANVDNTSDVNKPVSSATQSALNLKAPLASPTFTGTVTVPDGSFTIAKTTGLQTALDGKLANINYQVNLTDLPNQKLGRVDILADGTNSATWPDRLAFYFTPVAGTATRTGYHNEYGELRARPALSTTVALRAMAYTGNPSTQNIFEVTNQGQTATFLGISPSTAAFGVPVTSTGTITATNISTNKVSTGTAAPSSPAVGDVWVDTN